MTGAGDTQSVQERGKRINSGADVLISQEETRSGADGSGIWGGQMKSGYNLNRASKNWLYCYRGKKIQAGYYGERLNREWEEVY